MYLIAQVYLNTYLYIQVSANIAFSILQIAHLIYYKPFKETHVFISVLIGELVCVVFITSSIFFIGSISTGTSNALESLMIFIVLGGMGVQFLISLHSMLLGFRLLWKRLVKYKAKKFLKNH